MPVRFELESAREHLAKAEAALLTDAGLFHLQEGLARLEAALDSDGAIASLAENVGRTYTTRIYERVRNRVETGGNLTEPELEHLFAVIRSFDDFSFDLPPESRGLKIKVVKALIELYYEGYSPSEKEKIYKSLSEISGESE